LKKRHALLAVKKLNNMNTYRVKIEINAEVEAFSEEDAVDYANDIFGVDDEVKNVKVISVREK
jgi:hypothetical protein